MTARSISEALRIFKEARFPVGRDYLAETGNATELAAARSQPGVIFATTERHGPNVEYMPLPQLLAKLEAAPPEMAMYEFREGEHARRLYVTDRADVTPYRVASYVTERFPSAKFHSSHSENHLSDQFKQMVASPKTIFVVTAGKVHPV